MSDPRPRVLFIDAYDSFSENIISLIRNLLDATVEDIKIDADIARTFTRTEDAFFQQFHAIVLGPGPGNPLDNDDVGLYKAVWRIAAVHHIPVLGICLGFQSLCATHGLGITRLGMPCHGHAKMIQHNDGDIFKGVGQVVATCYNSLGVRLPPMNHRAPISRPRSPDSGYESKPVSSRTSFEIADGAVDPADKSEELQILGWDDDGWVQAVRHSSLPFWGLQFHPESCKSNSACPDILKKWWGYVKEHNQTLRPDVSSYSAETTEVQSSPPRGPAFLRLCEVLDQLSPVCDTGMVQYEEICSVASREQIANLCHQLSHEERLCMLESSKKGRFSIYAVTDETTWTLEYARASIKIVSDSLPDEQPLHLQDAMDLVEAFLSTRLVQHGPKDSPFWGGLIGSFSYELGLDLLNIKDPLESPPPREVPDYSLMWVDRSVVVDKQEGTIYVQSLRPNDEPWLSSTAAKVRHLSIHSATAAKPQPLDLTAATVTLPSHDKYTHQIDQCLSQLHVGNSYELCLTTSVPLTLPSLPPFTLHQHLLSHNPSPYSAILSHPSTTILSSSPEQFLTWPRPTPEHPGTALHMMPMKGTLAKTPTMTPQRAATLLATPKEEAENLMIVDLIRHDLHRALGPTATVDVAALFQLVEAETVYQLISHIRGRVPALAPVPVVPRVPSPATDPDTTTSGLRTTTTAATAAAATATAAQQRHTLHHAFSALQRTLPPGSMTGAPKKRSCELLRSLESRNRGAYAGVLGYFDVGGGGAFSVAIRCAFSPAPAPAAVDPDRDSGQEGETGATREWRVAAGGAITVLSDVEGEWDEMRVKMESVLRGFVRGGAARLG